MNYSLEHLKIVYNAGAKKLSFDQTIELITLLERHSLLHLVSNASASPRPKVGRPRQTKLMPKKQKKGAKRVKLSERLIEFLKTKGAGGAHVKEIASAVKAPPSSVTVWFYNTGKKHLTSGEIKKVGPATFAWPKA